MENSMDARELLWVEQQRTNRAQIDKERRQVLRYFLAVLAATLVTVAAASYLASRF